MALSGSTLITHFLDIDAWRRVHPDVEAARPSHCGACGAPACRQGGGFRLWGHGTRPRTVWGPPVAGARPVPEQLRVRRYRCTDCGATRTVVPRGVVQMFRYTLGAIGLALAYWAIWRRPQSRVRAAICPRSPAASPSGWHSLSHWRRCAHALFDLPLPPGPLADSRARMARVVRLLIARAPPESTELTRAFVGAVCPGITPSP